MSWMMSNALMEAYENSLSSQERVEEYWQENSLVGALSVPSSETPTPQAYLSPDRMTAFSTRSLSGMTFALLTDDRGAELLMWFLGAFPARTSALPERAKESTAHVRGFGLKWPASLMKYDPFTSSWRIAQHSLFGGLDVFSETWPRWGTMRNGECWALSMPGHLISGNVSGLLPTPLASIGTNGGPNQRDSSGRPGLQKAARSWPTPTKSDGTGGPGSSGGAGGLNLRTAVAIPTPTVCGNYNRKGASKTSGDSLATFVMKFPTPTKRDYKGGANWSNRTRAGKQRPLSDRTLPDVIESTGGQLNPTWVEWLMGWPLGWTDLKPLGMDRFRRWLHLHGKS